ncbi:Response regulator containing a CheY-like receiver domain and a GGDEF domain [Hyella patelloides LEGE 07179]|uniref:Response regulator containing a CheY-like receiver domain and a GGDEF domain n=1 Tax=Hyella patelloides LEGE 07179 TaxID=945734 RepID=A0A563VUN2_9CYAN|nr:response regulator [Hyella patelloides]VEP15147.1 Response regulator containing a CheY-like receiver domain and a GGDEF domain [Hyella patelloides LEGE 07179]
MTPTVKINPTGLLSRIASSKSYGCLELDEGLVSWKIYLQHGKLKYVYCSAQLLDQFKYYLHYLGWKQALEALKSPYFTKIQSFIQDQPSHQSLYSSVISWLLAEQYLTSFQGSKLIEQMTKDALQSCLWLNRGTFSWHNQEPIPPWIQEHFGNPLSLNISEHLDLEQKRLQQWQKCSTELLSVHQRPYFASGWSQKSLPSPGSLSNKTLNRLAQIVQGRISIRQLSLLLQKNELHVAQILSPYIDNKIIYLRDAQSPLDLLPSIPRPEKTIQKPSQVTSLTKRKRNIVCIDDSPTILKEIQRFLGQEKFQVTTINDPVKAVPIIFHVKPDLILMDISMPRINGYKLCSLLRGSEHCNETTIIMVTGNTGLIDKARAKIAGATDYLTKPFSKKGLMQIVEKYLK